MAKIIDFKGYFNPFKDTYPIYGYLPYFKIIG